MVYIRPGDPQYGTMPVARGSAAAHADEADVALPDIRGLLPVDVLATLENPEGVRGNPREAMGPSEDAPVVDKTLGQSDLFYPALLITGMWGGDLEGYGRVIEGPVRDNPATVYTPFAKTRPQIPVRFWDRMAVLELELTRLHAFARSNYDARWPAIERERRAKWQKTEDVRVVAGKKPRTYVASGERPWEDVMDILRQAVVFVRTQEGALRPRIFRHVPEAQGLKKEGREPTTRQVLRPFGLRWGILAEKGNVKLPFVSYSELPAVTCPGAGECLLTYDYYARRATAEDAQDDAVQAVKVENEQRAPQGKKSLPMYTAPAKGWCYSFKEWRYPHGYARQFLNTLANYADREFTIEAAGGPSDPTLPFYEARVRAAIAGSGRREWMQYVKFLAFEASVGKRTGPAAQTAFVRLFVDGDINTEDNILEWMRACRQIGPFVEGDLEAGRDRREAAQRVKAPKKRKGAKKRKGVALTEKERHAALQRDISQPIEVYGYSKCWRQFLNAHNLLGGNWPQNYTFNLSSGSVYDKNIPMAEALLQLPIGRGRFVAVDLHAYLKPLDEQTRLFRDAIVAAGQLVVVPEPAASAKATAGWALDASLVRAFLYINGVQGETAAHALTYLQRLPELEDFVPKKVQYDPIPTSLSPEKAQALRVKQTLDALRHQAFVYYLTGLLRTPEFLARVRKDLKIEERWGDAADRAKRALLNKATATGDIEVTKHMMDKALALALHDVLWTYGLGGSCPLVCGNCSDNPQEPKVGVHRCASKGLFRGASIHIGKH